MFRGPAGWPGLFISRGRLLGLPTGSFLMTMHGLLSSLFVLAAVSPAGAGAQMPASAAPADAEWNSGPALELVRRAQALRAETQVDTALMSYQADARGYVYFYLDREDTGERNLVKTDQVALDVFWRAPDLVKQRIVGWRDERQLPTNIRYHIDHLAVVHDNFGDLIRIGDGDEVSDVLHPAAPGAESFYEYRLADSLTLRLPGTPEPVRVYEVRVRPRDVRQPALLGSIFVDRRSGALVRMDFTFTPASYVDRNLDYINISLDNGLWMGRFWLPNQQRVELRRQIPELDIPAGSVIRGTMRVGNYRFNEEISPLIFYGPQVVVAPRADRESFPFEEGLYDEIRAEGIGPGTELREIRQQAMELARSRRLSGLPGTRPRIGSASEVLRYNRAEGAVVGLGISTRPTPTLSAMLQGGWATGPRHPLLHAQMNWQPGALQLGAGAFLNTPREVGGAPAVSGVINTVSTLLAGRDYTDLFYVRGGEVSGRWRASPEWSIGGELRLEEHASAALETEFSIFGADALRQVRPIDEGIMRRMALTAQRSAPAEALRWWTASVEGGVGSLAPHSAPAAGAGEPSRDFVRARADLGWGRRWAPRDARLELHGAAGAARGDLPRQELFLLGGRGTLPGYGFRAFGGDRFALGGATLSADVVAPWARVRLLGAAGWAGSSAASERALPLWGAVPTDGIRASVGAGVGLFFDILRVDALRGIGSDGRWELIVETRRSFWDFL